MKKVLDQFEITSQLKDLPYWRVEGNELTRDAEFPTYLVELEFVNKLGHYAEKTDHHPSMLLDFKRVRIRYSTHSAGGITEMDFDAAKKTEKLIEEFSQKKSS